MNKPFDEIKFRNTKEAFQNAINKQAFGKNNKDLGLYMYMYSSEGIDYFKHSISREYVSVKAEENAKYE